MHELKFLSDFSHAFVALQAFLVFVVILMAGYLAARTSRNLVSRTANTTFGVVCLFIWYRAAQGAATAIVLRIFPGVAS